MFVLTENDNLVEHLRLLIQNSALGDLTEISTPGDSDLNHSDDSVDALICTAAPLENRAFCGPSKNFILLLGKDPTPAFKDAACDVYRHIMTIPESGKIMVIKKEFAPANEQEIKIMFDNVYDEWHADWSANFEKIRKLNDSTAKQEALDKIDHWTSPQRPQFAIYDFDDQELCNQIKTFFNIDKVLRIRELSLTDTLKLFSKPPALHWTNYPREAEIQVSFKFTFPRGTLLEDVFRKWTASSKTCRKWEYEHEWVNGILLREDLIKITVIRTHPHIVEVSGRVDKDEVNDEDSATPFKPAWPYLAEVLKVSVDLLDEHPLLPYCLNLVMIGSLFFQTTKTGHSGLQARSLDAVQTLGALERLKSVRFKVNDAIYSLDLRQAFPGFQPTTISSFWQAPANECKTTPLQPVEVVPETLNRTGSADHSMAQTHLNVHKNRGRRVSFGAIRAIPTLGTAPTYADKNESDSDDKHSVSTSSLGDYVDDIVQKTMTQALNDS